MITDGPYVETKEFLGGFAVVDVADDEAAKMWAGRSRRHAAGPMRFAASGSLRPSDSIVERGPPNAASCDRLPGAKVRGQPEPAQPGDEPRSEQCLTRAASRTPPSPCRIGRRADVPAPRPAHLRVLLLLPAAHAGRPRRFAMSRLCAH